MDFINTPKGKIYFTQKLLFPGCHQIDRQIALDNLKVLNKVLSSTNIHWGVAFGTLLGIIRDNDFIEWDEDTDLYILKECEEEFKEVLWDLKQVGFELIRYERAGLYSILRNGEYIDFYVLSKISDDVRYTLDGCFVFERYLTERKQIDFRSIPLFVPRDVENYLSLEYGNWKKPVIYYSPQIGFIKRTEMILYCYFRLYSPRFLYFWWIKKLRTRDLKRFKIRCKEKGIYIDENLEMRL